MLKCTFQQRAGVVCCVSACAHARVCVCVCVCCLSYRHWVYKPRAGCLRSLGGRVWPLRYLPVVKPLLLKYQKRICNRDQTNGRPSSSNPKGSYSDWMSCCHLLKSCFVSIVTLDNSPMWWFCFSILVWEILLSRVKMLLLNVGVRVSCLQESLGETLPLAQGSWVRGQLKRGSFWSRQALT